MTHSACLVFRTELWSESSQCYRNSPILYSFLRSEMILFLSEMGTFVSISVRAEHATLVLTFLSNTTTSHFFLLGWIGMVRVVGENDRCYFLIILSVCKLRSYYLIFPIWKERKVFRKAAHRTSRTLDMIYNFWKENQNLQSPLEFHVGWGEGFCLIRNYLIAFCLQLVVMEIYDSFQSIRFH